ncbi:uncharacterized protein LOC135936276 [Cloeon dipterum]|uniref:uncharacterized protein LOC135936276 n=1 Tax=Cloeon dipterum TaxID=197152 RepID=UPI00321FC667
MFKVLLFSFLVNKSFQQDTLECVKETTKCVITDNRSRYFRCPSTGLYDNSTLSTNTYDCPTENSEKLFCFNSVTTGKKADSDIVGNTGPCLQLTCLSSGIFAAGSINVGACGTYYACRATGELPVLIDCSAGQHFNSATLRCEPASSAGCDPAFSTTQPPVESPQSTTPAAPICGGPGKFADPTNCRQYYSCGPFAREPKLKKCLGNLRFDEAIGRCKRNADCGSRPDGDLVTQDY